MVIASLINRNVDCGSNRVHLNMRYVDDNWKVLSLRSAKANPIPVDRILFKNSFLSFVRPWRLKSILDDYDGVLVDGLLNFYIIIPLILFIKPKVLFLIHNDYRNNSPRSRWRFIPESLVALLYDNALKVSSVEVVTCSETTRSQLSRYGVSSRVIKTGVVPFESSVRTNGNMVWYIGRLIRLKRVDTLVESANRLIKHFDFQLNIIGEGPERVQLMKTGLQQLNWLGEIKDPHLLLHEGDIFVLPSESEGRSVSVMEALFSGCFVICSSIEANLEFSSYGVEYFDVGDIDSLAVKLSEAISMGLSRRKAHVRKYSRKIKEELSVERTVKEYREAFDV